MSKPSTYLGARKTAISHLLLAFLDGNHEHAFFVSQMLYYAEHDLLYAGKWRIMEPDEWHNVTFIKSRRISDIVKSYTWLESSYQKSPFNNHTYPSGNGRKTLNWYGINIDKFNECFEQWVTTYENGKSRLDENGKVNDHTENDESVDHTENDESLPIDNKNEKENRDLGSLFVEIILNTLTARDVGITVPIEKKALNVAIDLIKCGTTLKDLKMLGEWIIENEWANPTVNAFLSDDYMALAKQDNVSPYDQLFSMPTPTPDPLPPYYYDEVIEDWED